MALIGCLSVIDVNTVINNEINDLGRQRISVEEHKQALKKLEQEELRAQ